MRVLVVDASRDQRQRIVTSLCELTNVVVVGAVSGVRSALYALAETTPDVLVMNGDDRGPELIAAAQRCIRPPDVIVYGDAMSEDRCLDAGAEHFVPNAAGLEGLQRAVSTSGRERRRRAPLNDRFAQIGRISASAAHDLRNYLGAAGLAVSRLDRTLDAGVRESLSTLKLALGLAERLASSMLAYGHGTVPDRDQVDLGLVVRNMVALFERTLPATIKTTVTIDPAPPIRGVPSELEQLVLNLVFNAVDAMPDGGDLGIAVRFAEARVVLEVRHVGPELAGGSRPPPLGLGIARDIAFRHDARLRILTLPSGNAVTVELPLGVK
jgi:signal transduction histidine kinase